MPTVKELKNKMNQLEKKQMGMYKNSDKLHDKASDIEEKADAIEEDISIIEEQIEEIEKKEINKFVSDLVKVVKKQGSVNLTPEQAKLLDWAIKQATKK